MEPRGPPATSQGLGPLPAGGNWPRRYLTGGCKPSQTRLSPCSDFKHPCSGGYSPSRAESPSHSQWWVPRGGKGGPNLYALCRRVGTRPCPPRKRIKKLYLMEKWKPTLGAPTVLGAKWCCPAELAWVTEMFCPVLTRWPPATCGY